MALMLRSKLIGFTLIVLLLCLPTSIFAQDDGLPLTVISWNVESGEAAPETIAQRIAASQDIDLWGLSEIGNQTDANRYEIAAEDGENANFEDMLGTTGGGDRLLILYDADRFEALGKQELSEINIENRVRAPLVGHFRDRETGMEFFFMVNHLYRGSESGRHRQARLLNEWAKAQTIPVIAVGDYNFDWEVSDDTHDEGYDLLTVDNVFKWVRPETLVRTQCEAPPVTCRFDSVLDFIFVSGEAQQWPATAEIIVVPGDFPDDRTTSDHRPVIGHFMIGGDDDDNDNPPVTKEMLLERIAQLEAELAELRELVKQLP